MRGRDKFKKYKPILIFIVSIINIIPYKLRVKLLVFFRNTKGMKGLAIRWILLKTCAKSCGDNVSIHPQVYLFDTQNIEFGNNVSIHPMCYIDGEGGIKIGNDVSIAHGTTIMSSTHQFNLMDIPIKDQSMKMLPIEIEDNVWVGAKVMFRGGITVGSGAVIGASSVVTHKIERNAIVVGNPAKTIKYRSLEDK